MWIYGAGGFGRETHDACIAAGLGVDGFLDDSGEASLRDVPVVSANEVEPTEFVVAIADPAVRLRLHRRMIDDGWRPVSVMDPRAVIGSGSSVGIGSVVLATAFVSCDVTLGVATHLNYGVTVGHDVVGRDGVTVLPGARVGGTVSLGEGVLVGSGAVILQGLAVGREATIGAGAVVTRGVWRGATVVGVPARPIHPSTGA